MIRNYFKIGKNAKAGGFLKALTREKTDNYAKNDALIKGAAEAFAEGRPENIQTAVAHASDVRDYEAPLGRALFEVTQKSNDKLAAIGRALEKVPSKRAALDQAFTQATSWGIGDTAFLSLLLKAKARELEKRSEQNGEAILRGTLDAAMRRGIGGEDFYLELLNTGLPKVPEADKERVLSETLNLAIEKVTSESFKSLLLKEGADANAKVDGYPGGLLVTAVSFNSPISVIELLHKNGASFDDAETTMHSHGYRTEDINRLKFFQEKLEGGKTAAAAAEAATQAVTKAVTVTEQSALAEQGDVRDILLEILAAVRELTEVVKADKSETPALAQDNPAQRSARKTGGYPTV